jgi:hypothetical protein
MIFFTFLSDGADTSLLVVVRAVEDSSPPIS